MSGTTKFWKHPVKRKRGVSQWDSIWEDEMNRLKRSVSVSVAGEEVHDILARQITDQNRTHNKDRKRLLILMSLKINSEDQIAKEIKWIEEDYSHVCGFYASCQWIVNVVAADQLLADSFHKHEQLLQLSGVEWHKSVSSSSFNKFAFVKRFLNRMLDYDSVLLKVRSKM
jgi:hypothetical protein